MVLTHCSDGRKGGVGTDMRIPVFTIKFSKRKTKSKSLSATKQQGFLLICKATMRRKFNIRQVVLPPSYDFSEEWMCTLRPGASTWKSDGVSPARATARVRNLPWWPPAVRLHVRGGWLSSWVAFRFQIFSSFYHVLTNASEDEREKSISTCNYDLKKIMSQERCF